MVEQVMELLATS